MNPISRPLALAVLVLGLCAGCSSDAVKRAAYESAHAKACMDRDHTPQCDIPKQDYDTYQHEREKTLPQ